MWDHPFKSIFDSASPCCYTWQLYHAWQPSSSESLRRSFMSVSDTNSPSTHISCSEVFSFNLLRLLVTKLSWWGFVPKAPRNKYTQKPKQYHPRCFFVSIGAENGWKQHITKQKYYNHFFGLTHGGMLIETLMLGSLSQPASTKSWTIRSCSPAFHASTNSLGTL